MSSQTIKTNNDTSLLLGKIKLRLESLPEKQEVKVLEAFGGEGVLWHRVKKLVPEKTIKILSIDKKNYQRIQLQGDNLKYLMAFNLSDFDIIDLDAWGSPVKQLEILFKKKYEGTVHCTFIQSLMGNLPNDLLYANGYTPSMLKKIRTIFVKDGLQKFLNYLSYNKVKKVRIITSNRKNYLYFNISQE